MDNNNYDDCIKIGNISGTLIFSSQMIADGYDPLTVCDDESQDLEYTMSALSDEGGPLNEWTGDPMMDTLYIDELTIEDELLQQEIGSRILQELPALCLELLHITPDILAYYPAPTEDNWYKKSEREIALEEIAAKRIIKPAFSEETDQTNSKIISIADRYKFSEDEINMLIGRRFSGSSYPEELKDNEIIEFYQKNGFQELGDSRLLFAYTKM
jgi:hypothetical protein